MEFEKYLDLYQTQNEYTDFLSYECIDNHTMRSDHLRGYIEQKLPIKELWDALGKISIEVHGIYPEHAEIVLRRMGVSNIQAIQYKSNPKVKEYNYIRPKFFFGIQDNSDKLFVAVTPGEDYVFQYGEMLRFFAVYNNIDFPEKCIKIFTYPLVNLHIADWTQLDSKFIFENDIVIIGYVNEIERRLNDKYSMQLISSESNLYHGSRRYKFGGNIVNFLGVKFSFWGTISALLAKRFCELGATEIIYSAKTGSLTSERDLYHRLYCPKEYINMNREKFLNKVSGLKNSLLIINPTINTNLHVSTPTVLEQDFRQRDEAIKRGAKSIDIETSQIANMLQQYNFRHHKDIKLSCLHFATDYLYGYGEDINDMAPNLVKGRQREFTLKKEKVLDKMAEIIGNYLNSVKA